MHAGQMGHSVLVGGGTPLYGAAGADLIGGGGGGAKAPDRWLVTSGEESEFERETNVDFLTM